MTGAVTDGLMATMYPNIYNVDVFNEADLNY